MLVDRGGDVPVHPVRPSRILKQLFQVIRFRRAFPHERTSTLFENVERRLTGRMN